MIIPPVLIGWLLAVMVAIWWPRSDSAANQARTRSYRACQYAASLLLPGYLLTVFAQVALVGWELLPLLLPILVVIAALALTPLAIGMLALDIGSRPLGLVSAVLAALFAAGLAGLNALNLLAAIADIWQGGSLIPGWWPFVLAPATLLCGGATAFILETYTLMRWPR